MEVVDPNDQVLESHGPARTITNTYSWGRLSGVTGYTTSMSYHENGMLNAVVHTNGVTDTFGLDVNSMQRPKSITVSGADAGTWTTGEISYDGVGNITTMGSDWFSYDGMSRLTRAHLDDVDRDKI
ncbi:MAG: hypothetical protein K8R59_04415 [Thermoanaerobaculales bacterium]|nr:hypothetical protein [Thermoanaerobaculales bacterium]